MNLDFDVAIIGAGVVGLALAERLSRGNRRVVVIDKDASFGRGVSSRNSEVIHAGLYYPEGSLKARLCVEGRKKLYAFCQDHKIPHRACGKLVVANGDAEDHELDRLMAAARACGVTDLSRLTGAQVEAMEPMVTATSAIHSPSTGIVSAHHLMAKLYRMAKKRGVLFSFGTELVAAESIVGGTELRVRYGDGQEESFSCEVVINAAGLYSDFVAASLGFEDEGTAIHWWRGEYATLDIPPGSLNTLIYPVPNAARTGLGIHTTISLDGSTRLGPNAEYMPVKEEAYGFNPEKLASFYGACSRYLKGVTPEMIGPGMVGIRPKRQAPGDPVKDFLIHRDARKGHVHLVGIESPGLTASLAIADDVWGTVQ